RRVRPAPYLVRQRLDAQHVVQVDDQLVLPDGQGHIPRHAVAVPQPPHGGELPGPAGQAERGEVAVPEVPAGSGQDQPAADDAGQERRLPQWPQVPGDPGGDLLVLQSAEETVDAETARDVVVRGREPRDHLAPQPLGTEYDPLVLDGYEQVRQRKLAVGRRTGASEVR